MSEHNARRTSHRRIAVRESKFPRLAIDAVGAQAVALLIAHVEKLAGGIEVKVAGMIAICGYLSDEVRPPIIAD